jgi:hypothetical protein
VLGILSAMVPSLLEYLIPQELQLQVFPLATQLEMPLPQQERRSLEILAHLSC